MAEEDAATRLSTDVVSQSEMAVLEIRHLKVQYDLGNGRRVQAVDDLNCRVMPGKTLGIVGESGSGKTTALRAVLRIVNSPGKITDGQVLYHGRDLLRWSEAEMRRFRGNKAAMIFQNPAASLDPLFTIGQQFIETIRTHTKLAGRQALDRALEVLDLTGVPDPTRVMAAYPMQFSAGMIQRIMIGMAISCQPDIILADEPTTTLGVLLQAQILNALVEIQRKLGTAMLLVTHDMGVVAHIADDVLVMYAGRCMEYSTKDQVMLNPRHPYTAGLIRSVPEIDQPRQTHLSTVSGFPPDLSCLPDGCPFAPRCTRRLTICKDIKPELIELEPGHYVSCHAPVERKEEVELPNV